MAWTIEFDPAAAKELGKLDPQTARRILKFLRERIAPAQDPRNIGEALKGRTLGNFWRYRVGDHRLIVDIDDHAVRVLVLRIGNRRDVYRR